MFRKGFLNFSLFKSALSQEVKMHPYSGVAAREGGPAAWVPLTKIVNLRHFVI